MNHTKKKPLSHNKNYNSSFPSSNPLAADKSFAQEMIEKLIEFKISKHTICQETGVKRATLNRLIQGKSRNLRLQAFHKLLCFYAAKIIRYEEEQEINAI